MHEQTAPTLIEEDGEGGQCVVLAYTLTHYFHDNKLLRRFALKKPFLGATHTMQLSTSDPIFNIMTPNTAPDQHKNPG